MRGSHSTRLRLARGRPLESEEMFQPNELRVECPELVEGQDSDGMTGRRLVASKWRTDQGGKEAAEAAIDMAGWQ